MMDNPITNVISVDFALASMIKSVEEWYEEYYQCDHMGTVRKAHVFHLISFYDEKRFKDHDTIGEERSKFLEEIGTYIQTNMDD